jgi:hypothetical protein
LRELATDLSRRFRQRQIGRILRALTVDEGRSVVTANFLKLGLDVPRPRNEWVDVRVMTERDAAFLRGV